MNKASVFITGATGLLGSHLARLLLARGHDQIFALRRSGSRMELLGEDADRIHWIEGDILDLQALAEGMHEKDWAFHSAGLISYHPKDQEALRLINVEGTANVVNTALRSGVQKLLHVSSVSVLPRNTKAAKVNETTPWQRTKHTSNYGISKHLAEKEVQRGIAEGLSASSIIPSVILGAGMWTQGSAAIFHRIGRGMPLYPKGVNGYVDVRDVALLAIKVMEQNENYRVIGNGHTVGYHDLFSKIATRLSASHPKIPIGSIASEIGWRIMIPFQGILGRHSPYTKEMLRAVQCHLEYENSLSLTIPGFRYTPFDKTVDDIAEKYLVARKKNFEPGFLDFGPEYLT